MTLDTKDRALYIADDDLDRVFRDKAGKDGHHCTIATCRFFTSSYAGSRYYYDRRTCSQWKSLTRTYLQGFNTKAALLAKYNRRLHPPC